MKAKPADPVFSKEVQKAFAKADQSGAVWGAGLISAGMKEAPPRAAFDEFVLSTTELEGKGSRMRADLLGSDPQAISASIDQMKQHLKEGIGEMEQLGQPGMAPMLKIMKSVKLDAMGLNASISVIVDGGPSTVLGLLISRFGVRSGR